MTAAKGTYGGKIEDLPLIDTPDLDSRISKRVVFGPGRFLDDQVVRYFTSAPGVKTPFHSHDWPHHVFIMDGEAMAKIAGETYSLPAGSWAYVPPNAEHFFENVGDRDLKFL